MPSCIRSFAGLATGGIYASVALALVMIYQATHHVNFAQGEMAMFSTYIAWSLINAGCPTGPAFFAHGRDRIRRSAWLIERILMRPVEKAPVLSRGGRVHRPAGDHSTASPAGSSATRSRCFRARSRDSRCAAATTSSPRTSSARSASRWWCWRCCTHSSASPRSAWRCARRRRIRYRAAWSASASAGCWRWAGAWPRRSARLPA